MKKKIPSLKVLNALQWFSRVMLCFSIGRDCYLYGKTGHLSAPISFFAGINVATLIWTEINELNRKKDGELFAILHKQSGLIGELFKMVERGGNLSSREPIDPGRN